MSYKQNKVICYKKNVRRIWLFTLLSLSLQAKKVFYSNDVSLVKRYIFLYACNMYKFLVGNCSL